MQHGRKYLNFHLVAIGVGSLDQLLNIGTGFNTQVIRDIQLRTIVVTVFDNYLHIAHYAAHKMKLPLHLAEFTHYKSNVIFTHQTGGIPHNISSNRVYGKSSRA